VNSHARGAPHRWTSSGQPAGIDKRGTSAPQGSIDDAASAAIAAFRMMSQSSKEEQPCFGQVDADGTSIQCPQQPPANRPRHLSAAQRLLGQGGGGCDCSSTGSNFTTHPSNHLDRNASGGALEHLALYSAPLLGRQITRSSEVLSSAEDDCTLCRGSMHALESKQEDLMNNAPQVMSGDLAEFFGEASIEKLAVPQENRSNDRTGKTPPGASRSRSSFDILLSNSVCPPSRQSEDSLLGRFFRNGSAVNHGGVC